MPEMSEQAQQLEAARAVKVKVKALLDRFGPISAVGITRSAGRYAVKVNFETEPEPWSELPEEVDGVPVVIHVVGQIRKQT